MGTEVNESGWVIQRRYRHFNKLYKALCHEFLPPPSQLQLTPKASKSLSLERALVLKRMPKMPPKLAVTTTQRAKQLNVFLEKLLQLVNSDQEEIGSDGPDAKFATSSFILPPIRLFLSYRADDFAGFDIVTQRVKLEYVDGTVAYTWNFSGNERAHEFKTRIKLIESRP